MRCETSGWILWTVTIIILLNLALAAKFDALIAAIVIAALVWGALLSPGNGRPEVVHRTDSRSQ